MTAQAEVERSARLFAALCLLTRDPEEQHRWRSLEAAARMQAMRMERDPVYRGIEVREEGGRVVLVGHDEPTGDEMAALAECYGRAR